VPPSSCYRVAHICGIQTNKWTQGSDWHTEVLASGGWTCIPEQLIPAWSSPATQLKNPKALKDQKK